MNNKNITCKAYTAFFALLSSIAPEKMSFINFFNQASEQVDLFRQEINNNLSVCDSDQERLEYIEIIKKKLIKFNHIDSTINEDFNHYKSLVKGYCYQHNTTFYRLLEDETNFLHKILVADFNLFQTYVQKYPNIKDIWKEFCFFIYFRSLLEINDYVKEKEIRYNPEIRKNSLINNSIDSLFKHITTQLLKIQRFLDQSIDNIDNIDINETFGIIISKIEENDDNYTEENLIKLSELLGYIDDLKITLENGNYSEELLSHEYVLNKLKFEFSNTSKLLSEYLIKEEMIFPDKHPTIRDLIKEMNFNKTNYQPDNADIKYKIGMEISVAQISALFKILYNNDIFIKGMNKSRLCRIISENFYTHASPKISEKSVKNNFDNPDQSALLFWKEEFKKISNGM